VMERTNISPRQFDERTSEQYCTTVALRQQPLEL